MRTRTAAQRPRRKAVFGAAAVLVAAIPVAALAENASNAKLLKSWFRNSDPATAISVPTGDSVDIFASPVSVTCPAGVKCVIEVEVDLGVVAVGSGLEASAKVEFGAKEVIGGSLYLTDAAARMPYHWSYVERVGPGTYPIQVSAIADAAMNVDMYAVAIRLYKRP